MQLYIVPGSPNCRKVQAVVHELEIPVELVMVDFRVQEHKGSAYLSINPNGLVPTLVDGDLRLWESHAIMQYLADRRDSSLFPRELGRRADVVRWQCWELAHFGLHLGTALYERLFKPMLGMAPDEAVAVRALEAWRPFAAIAQRELDERPFLAGAAITLADYSVAPQVAMAKLAGIDLTPYPALRAWLDRLDEREAWRATAMPGPMREAIEQAMAAHR